MEYARILDRLNSEFESRGVLRLSLKTSASRMLPSVSLIALLVIISTLNLAEGGGDGGHHHIIIHVPYHIKKIKHTHTITKHIHHGGGGDKYEVLGYTVGQPIKIEALGGHETGGHEVGGHEAGGHEAHGDFSGYGGHGGEEIQENQIGHYGVPSVEHVGNELQQENFHLGGHVGGISSFGGAGGHQEYSRRLGY